jgi:hypothetical protein
MAAISLYEYQKKAVNELSDGCILCGGVGTGKSRTSLAYFYKEMGGDLGAEEFVPMKRPKPLYIITTARKRDTKEWDQELIPFHIYTETTGKDLAEEGFRDVAIDSWNNIEKYRDVTDAFFIFDEQRVVGYGAWVKAFLKIAKDNRWILLSATPGDTWSDYIPVFIANGFYKNKTEFCREHVVYSRFTKYPKIDRYINTGRLIRLRRRILVDMPMERKTVMHNESIFCEWDKPEYNVIGKDRFNIYTGEPIVNASELCYTWRKLVNSDPSRSLRVLELMETHPKVIIFYNFDYELEILLETMKTWNEGQEEKVDVAEWNGHKHQPIPESERWAYLVQYTAGCEGWNCITTDTIVFYSQNYSYKVMEQASGRINRLNTPFVDLYCYHLKSSAPIDLAISRALKQKKNFTEGRFVGQF